MSSSVDSLLKSLADKASTKFLKEAESLLSTKLESFKKEALNLLPDSPINIESVTKDFVSKLNGQLLVSLDSLVAKFETQAQEFINQSSSGNMDELTNKLEDASENAVFDSITSLESKLQGIADAKLSSLSSDGGEESEPSENVTEPSAEPSTSEETPSPRKSKRSTRVGRLAKLTKR